MVEKTLKHALDLWQNNEKSQAVSLLEEFDEKEYNSQIVLQLLNFYHELNMNKKLIKLVENQKHFNVHYWHSYYQALLAEKEFMKARQLICKSKNNLLHISKQDKLAEIKVVEQDYRNDFPKTISEIQKAFFNIGGQPLEKQNQILQKANYLDMTSYLNVAKIILVSPFLNQFTRVSILNIIFEAGYRHTVEYQWVNQTNLKVSYDDWLESQAFKTNILNEIDEISDDISKLSIIKQQVNIQLGIVSPFPNKIFANEKEWLKNIKLLYIDGMPSKLSNVDRIISENMM